MWTREAIPAANRQDPDPTKKRDPWATDFCDPPGEDAPQGCCSDVDENPHGHDPAAVGRGRMQLQGGGAEGDKRERCRTGNNEGDAYKRKFGAAAVRARLTPNAKRSSSRMAGRMANETDDQRPGDGPMLNTVDMSP